jgi:LCP family protein required for cell wall assembly
VVNAETESILSIVTDPDLIMVTVAINLIVGLIRLLAATDAWWRAGGRIMRFGLAALLVFTMVPHAALAYVGFEARSTILRVFPEPLPQTPIPVITTTSSTTSTVPSKPPLVKPWLVPTNSTTTTTTTTIPLGTERLTFLLLGGDAGPGRSGLRTDTVMVATVDIRSGAAAIFGLPRNMAGFRFSDGSEFPGTSRGILNEVYKYGWQHPDRFGGPDPGINALRDVVQTTLGIPIDRYVLVEMSGFADLVDVMGGVTVNPQRSFDAPLYYEHPEEYEMITFEPGIQHLDGAHALAYARSRTNSNDYARMARQRCLVTSLAASASPLSMVGRLVELLDLIERRVTTDVPASELPFLINFAPSVASGEVAFVGFDVDYRTDRKTLQGDPVVDIPLVQSTVASILQGDVGAEIPNFDLSESACGL